MSLEKVIAAKLVKALLSIPLLCHALTKWAHVILGIRTRVWYIIHDANLTAAHIPGFGNVIRYQFSCTLYEENNLSYSAINTARSVLSLVIFPFEGCTLSSPHECANC